MNLRNLCFFLYMASWLFPTAAGCYELTTHGGITRAAYGRSVLKDASFRATLGLPKISQPFGDVYFDVAGTINLQRTANPFEGAIIKGALGVDPLSIEGWLMRGVIREDDVPSFAGDNPQDDSYGSIFRVFNHFYDPINNIPLTVGGIRPGSVFGDPNEPAPGWAIGTQNIFSSPILPDENRRNHFTVFDAREAMYRALTGRNAQGNQFIASSQTERNKYWATTFRALGDVVHLLQDMAQPQHTRNEVHCGRSYNFPTIPGCGHKSVYENYIDARAKGEAFVVVNLFGANQVRTQAQPLTYSGYDIPSFSDYASFYTTREGNIFARRGMADYSNRGFFTAGKNVGNLDYASPGPGPYGTVKLTQDWNGNALPSNAGVVQLVGPVTDALTSNSQTVSLSTFGMWDQFLLSSQGLSPSYTLTKPNYDDMASLLIPRAVAYSAGLINYFFRGKMQISLPPDGVYSLIDTSTSPNGFSKVKLVLANTSAPGEDMVGGQALAVAKFHRNNCYRNDLSGEMGLPANDYNTCRSKAEEIVVSASKPLTLAAGVATAPLTFDFSNNPIPLGATDLYLQVVYRGKLGQEADAVAVTTLDIAEPTTFDITNMTDYVLLDSTYYYVPDPYNPTGIPSPALYGRTSLARESLSYIFNLGGGSASGSVTLPPSSFARLAILTDTTVGTAYLTKLTYGYTIGFLINPNINQLNPVTGVPIFSTPFFSRGRYVYQDSPDYLFRPEVIPVPANLLPLVNLTPQAVTIPPQ